MAHNPSTDAAIVVFVLNALAPTRVHGFPRYDTLVVMVFVVLTSDESAAGGLLRCEAAVRSHRRLPLYSDVTGDTPKAETPKRARGGSMEGPSCARNGRMDERHRADVHSVRAAENQDAEKFGSCSRRTDEPGLKIVS